MLLHLRYYGTNPVTPNTTWYWLSKYDFKQTHSITHYLLSMTYYIRQTVSYNVFGEATHMYVSELCHHWFNRLFHNEIDDFINLYVRYGWCYRDQHMETTIDRLKESVTVVSLFEVFHKQSALLCQTFDKRCHPWCISCLLCANGTEKN